MPTALPFAAVISATALSLAACLGDLAPALTTMQLEPAGPPEFDAASLKRAADQDHPETRPKRSIGRFKWNSYLLNMLSYAYHIE